MKVLHLPNNVSSQVSITVKALCSLNMDPKRIKFAKRAFELMEWADVIQWHFNTRILPFDLDIKYPTLKKKASLVEFWGSDIRIPRIASSDKVYIKKMFEDYPQLTLKAEEKSFEPKRIFAKYGYECIMPDKANLMPKNFSWNLQTDIIVNYKFN